MVIGTLLITVFFISLPWVWYNIPGGIGVALRPSVVASIPLVLFFFWKIGLKLKEINYTVVFFLVFIFIVWMIPSFFYDNPHWSKAKVLSVFVYTILAYFSARVYIIVVNDKSWTKYWPYIGLLFLVSCAYSFYTVFGSLIPNTNITSSSGFIHQSLYGHMFDSSQKGGKGIRHTMAIVPTILLALSIHNRSISPKINTIILILVLYLVLYTFSRSAWLVTILMMILLLKLNVKELNKNAIKIVIMSFAGIVILMGVFIVFPDKLFWVGNILSDRVSDTQSTDGRLWILIHTFTDSTFSEYVMGNNDVFQQSPHNMMLDALMQSGLVGFFSAVIIFIYTANIYKLGLLKGSMQYVVPAAFATPALIRMLTAGSGMLHMVELFGLCVAANIIIKTDKDTEKISITKNKPNSTGTVSSDSVRLRK